jgi:hypothetical protein
MINDLPSFVNTHSIMYADDTTFFNFSNDYNSLKTITENTLSQISHWLRANGFLLNESKNQDLICHAQKQQREKQQNASESLE